MKQKLLLAAAAAAMATAPTAAFAQDSGVYIKGQVGYGAFVDSDVTPANNNSFGLLGEIAGEGDGGFALAVGYDYGDVRLEVAYNNLYNDMGTVGGQPFSSAKLRSSDFMLNAIYDFSDFGRLEPYVGVGIGVANLDASLFAQDFILGNRVVNSPACTSTPVPATQPRACIVSDDTGFNFAWNLLAGVGYKITDNLTWDTTYRYADFGNADLQGTAVRGNVPGGGVFTPLDATISDVASHTLMTGFRYRFGKPAPVIVEPVTFTCDDGTVVTDLDLCPVPTFTCWDGVTEVTDLDLCPAQPVYYTCPDGVTSVTDLAACPVIETCDEQFRQELIYYEFDVAESAETRNSINRVLDVGQFCGIDSIRVVGHTDTSGSRVYNQGLSERRAADAVEELQRQGVNSGIISSEGKGETEPFVQTGDGVREQLNRRTEVLLTLSEVGSAMN